MSKSYKELAKTAKKEFFLPGNSSCAGCGLELALRWTLKALGQRTIIVCPASCTNVVVGLYPKTAMGIAGTNMAFAAGCAAAAGIRTGLKARGIEDITVLCWSGDGGAYDIGLQSSSGAAERNDDILYICYDNEAYMNTGTQRSGGTPYGAWTTTTPFGKTKHKKDLPGIMIAHRIPYVATASTGYPNDLYDKVSKAKDIKGFKYIHIHAPCPPGWRYDSDLTVEISKDAVETGMWILYEFENGEYKLSKPSEKIKDAAKRKPVRDYLRKQERFKRMSDEEINILQTWINENWEKMEFQLQYCR